MADRVSGRGSSAMIALDTTRYDTGASAAETVLAMFVLVVNRRGATHRHPLREGRTVIGRAPTCDIVVDDESISRQHAELVVRRDDVTLSDLGSSNGTYRNDLRVGTTGVTPGDRMRFGGVDALLERASAAVPAAPPAAIDAGSTMMRPIDELPGTSPQHEAIDAPRLIRLLAEIARTLVIALPLPEVLNRVLDLLLTHVPAERVSLLLADPATGALVPHLGRRSDGRAAEATTISQTLIDLTLAERVAILTCDVRTDPRFIEAHSIYRADIRSLICGPLFEGNRIIGILSVDNPVARQFSEADLELFTALANYAAVAIAQARLAERLAEESRRRERLARYHSPGVVEVLARQEDDDVMPAQERDISVLFADIVGFTAIAEARPPAEVATILNVFFSRMTDEVFREVGSVDKFIGDAILAVFGAPVEQHDHAGRAVRAARAMRRAVAEMNADGTLPHLRVRYAINSGIAIVGDVGSTKRRDYTVLGDVVNTASRLVTLAEPDQIVISRATFDRIEAPLAVTSLGQRNVRGRTGTIEILAVDV